SSWLVRLLILFYMLSNSHCEHGYLLYGDFCYRFETEVSKNWLDAEDDYCVSRGANLASIHSHDEEAFLSQYSPGSSKWIGLNHNPTEGGGCNVYSIEWTHVEAS
uniref:C-type lectin domain-containing protein n=1 Tax=Mastacembelus armatus TaxID=205130 RepID=A0A3Q3MM23_9TELE